MEVETETFDVVDDGSACTTLSEPTDADWEALEAIINPAASQPAGDGTTMTPNPIPAELREREQWVCWRKELRDGKPTKVPYYANAGGNRADSKAPETWRSYNAAVRWAADPSMNFEGIGYVFSKDDPFTGIDLDDALDENGQPKPWAKDILDQFPSYAEVSPSGTGIKLFTRGKLPPNPNRKAQGTGRRTALGDGVVEVYDSGRFFTVTGRRYAGSPSDVTGCQEQLDALYARLFPAKERAASKPAKATPAATPATPSAHLPAEPGRSCLTDDDIIRKATASRQGEKFTRLFFEGSEVGFPSKSEAMESLLCILAFWTGRDHIQMERLANRSKLAEGYGKWRDRQDYRDRSIEAACEHVTEVYKPSHGATLVRMNSGTVEELLEGAAESAVEVNINPDLYNALSAKIDLQAQFDAEPEQVKRLTRLLYTASSKMPAAAWYAAALGIVCAMAGKKLVPRNNRDYYCNVWHSILIPTAKGKSDLEVTEHIVRDLVYDIPACPFDVLSARFTIAYAFSELGGHVEQKKWSAMSEREQIAAKRDIREACRRKKAKLILCDEFTHTFAKILGSGTSDGELGAVLKLADSGATIPGNTGTNGYRVIEDACVSIVGFTQPDVWHAQFEHGDNLASGLIGRFLVFNADDYALTVEKLALSPASCRVELRTLLFDLVTLYAALPARVVADWNADTSEDRLGSIFDRVLSKKFAAVQEAGTVNFEDVRGKLIAQAIKYAMTSRVIGTPSGEVVAAVPNIASDDPLGDWKEVAPAPSTPADVEAPNLIDWTAFERYLTWLMANYVKLATAEVSLTAAEKVQKTIVGHLQKAEGHKMRLRDLTVGKSLRIGKDRLKAGEVKDLIAGLVERKIVTVTEAGKNSFVVKWTGRPFGK